MSLNLALISQDTDRSVTAIACTEASIPRSPSAGKQGPQVGYARDLNFHASDVLGHE